MMDSKFANEERLSFAARLRQALLDAHQPVGATAFVRAYNLRAVGHAVTSHAARKWLKGEAIPTQEKITVLAHWLNVHASWLRFGEAQNSSYGDNPPVETMWTNENLMLVHDIRMLTPVGQTIVRDLVDSLMRGGGKARHSFVNDDLSLKKPK